MADECHPGTRQILSGVLPTREALDVDYAIGRSRHAIGKLLPAGQLFSRWENRKKQSPISLRSLINQPIAVSGNCGSRAPGTCSGIASLLGLSIHRIWSIPSAEVSIATSVEIAPSRDMITDGCPFALTHVSVTPVQKCKAKLAINFATLSRPIIGARAAERTTPPHRSRRQHPTQRSLPGRRDPLWAVAIKTLRRRSCSSELTGARRPSVTCWRARVTNWRAFASSTCRMSAICR